MSLEEKWEKDRNPLSPVKNENLVCINCKSIIAGNVAKCEVYNVKPLSVLKGGICYEYKEKK